MLDKFFPTYLTVFFISLLITFMVEKRMLPVLCRRAAQPIYEDGPRWHMKKSGTPTMGGISFILAAVIIFAVFGIYMLFTERCGSAVVITMIMAVLNGCIGVIDDLAKFSRKQNEGLTAKQKYALQFLVAVCYIAALGFSGNLSTAVHIPFTGVSLELGIFYYLFAVILITGIVNSVNLTDGIDGLASSVTAVVGILFAVISMKMANDGAALLSAILIGGCLGFLVYNFYPARVFMGDTGSLFLGGMVIGIPFMLNEPLIIVLAGIIYIAESASVIIQVLYFKATKGKRFFKMAPIHHHFEMCGWNEIKLVAVFSAVTAIMSAAAYFAV